MHHISYCNTEYSSFLSSPSPSFCLAFHDYFIPLPVLPLFIIYTYIYICSTHKRGCTVVHAACNCEIQSTVTEDFGWTKERWICPSKYPPSFHFTPFPFSYFHLHFRPPVSLLSFRSSFFLFCLILVSLYSLNICFMFSFVSFAHLLSSFIRVIYFLISFIFFLYNFSLRILFYFLICIIHRK
jgi:hypothetical protein